VRSSFPSARTGRSPCPPHRYAEHQVDAVDLVPQHLLPPGVGEQALAVCAAVGEDRLRGGDPARVACPFIPPTSAQRHGMLQVVCGVTRGIMAEPAADVGASDVSPLRSWIVRHPIATFLVLVYATTTALVFVPKG
jgi:hypothetical protein